MVDEAAVLKALRKSSSLEAAGRALVQAANKAGGEDNITVILFSIGEGDQEPLPLSGAPTTAVGEASAGAERRGRSQPVGGRRPRSHRRRRPDRSRSGASDAP